MVLSHWTALLNIGTIVQKLFLQELSSAEKVKIFKIHQSENDFNLDLDKAVWIWLKVPICRKLFGSW